MSERRMFSNSVVSTDDFTEMPLSSQALYFHLGMHADDDGFVANAKSVICTIGAREDDMRVLLAKRYLIEMGRGLFVVRHWKRNNYIQADRYKKTVYQSEFAQLQTAAENRVYEVTGIYCNAMPEGSETVGNSDDRAMDTKCIQNVSESDTQNSIGKYREEETRKEKHIPPKRNVYGEFHWVKMTDEEYGKLIDQFGETEVNNAIRYIDELAETTGNKSGWKNWNLVIRRCLRDGWHKGFAKSKPQASKKQVSEMNYDDLPKGWDEF